MENTSTRDPSIDKLLQGLGVDVSPETVQMALAFANAMKNKSNDECEAVLEALSGEKSNDEQKDQNHLQHPAGTDLECSNGMGLSAGSGHADERAKVTSGTDLLDDRGLENGFHKEKDEKSYANVEELVGKSTPEELRGGVNENDQADNQSTSAELAGEVKDEESLSSDAEEPSEPSKLHVKGHESSALKQSKDENDHVDNQAASVGQADKDEESISPDAERPTEPCEPQVKQHQPPEEKQSKVNGQVNDTLREEVQLKEIDRDDTGDEAEVLNPKTSGEADLKFTSSQDVHTEHSQLHEGKSAVEELPQEIKLRSEEDLEKSDFSDKDATLSLESSKSEVTKVLEPRSPADYQPPPTTLEQEPTAEPEMFTPSGETVAERDSDGSSTNEEGAEFGGGSSEEGKMQGRGTSTSSHGDQDDSLSTGDVPQVEMETSFQQLPQSLAELFLSRSTSSELPSTKNPLYYQPHLVMEGTTPFLVFQPVIQDLSGSNSDDSTSSTPMTQSGIPLRIPLCPAPGVSTAPQVLKEETPYSKIKDSAGMSQQGTRSQSASPPPIPPRVTPVFPKLETGAIYSTSGSDSEDSSIFAQSNSDSMEGVSNTEDVLTVPEVEIPDVMPVETETIKGTIYPPCVSQPKEILSSDFLSSSSGLQDSCFLPFSGDVVSYSDPHTDSGYPRPLSKSNPFADDVVALKEQQGLFSQKGAYFPTLPSQNRDDTYTPPTQLTTTTATAPGARQKVSFSSQTESPSLSGTRKPSSNPFSPPEPPKTMSSQYIQEQRNMNFSDDLLPHSRMPGAFMPTHGELTSDPRTPVTSVQSTQVAAENVSQAREKPQDVPKLQPQNGQESALTKETMPGLVAPLWVRDFMVSHCTLCKTKFTVMRRKHHCRGCGKIFCNRCCSQLARLPYMQLQIARICRDCTEHIKKALKNGKKGQASSKNAGRQTHSNSQPKSTAGSRLHGAEMKSPMSTPSSRQQQQGHPRGAVPPTAGRRETQVSSVNTAPTSSVGQMISVPGRHPSNVSSQMPTMPVTSSGNQAKQQVYMADSRQQAATPRQFTPAQTAPTSNVGQVMLFPVQQQGPPGGAVLLTAGRSGLHGQAQVSPVKAAPTSNGGQVMLVPVQQQGSPAGRSGLLGQAQVSPVKAAPTSNGGQVMLVPVQQQGSTAGRSGLHGQAQVSPVKVAPTSNGGQVMLVPVQQQGSTAGRSGLHGQAQVLPVKAAPTSNGGQVMLVPVQQQGSTAGRSGLHGQAQVLPNKAAPTSNGGQVMLVPVQQAGSVMYVNPNYVHAPAPQTLLTYPAQPSYNPMSPVQNQVLLLPNQSFAQPRSEFYRLPQEGVTGSLPQQVVAGTGQFAVRSGSGGSQTITMFTTLPQHVGQNAVQNAEANRQEQQQQRSQKQQKTVGVMSSSEASPSNTDQPYSAAGTTNTPPSSENKSQKQVTDGAGTAVASHPGTVTAVPWSGQDVAAETQVPLKNPPAKSSGTSTESVLARTVRESDGSFIVNEDKRETAPQLRAPLRPAGKTISWTFNKGKSKLSDQRKSLARDLKTLPNGVSIQSCEDLLVDVKKIKMKQGSKALELWCFHSDGFGKFHHQEVVFLLEVLPKEDVFPEEFLRAFRAIHFLVKSGHVFEHGQYLAMNSAFLEGADNAGFLFVSSDLQPKLKCVRDFRSPFLYCILVKRSELTYAMYTPTRLLLRLGYATKCFPFPLWNNRNRVPVYYGTNEDDRFFNTLHAMNKYLKNSIPEAMIPGLFVVKEGNKIILQLPHSSYSVIANLLDRLMIKDNQTATIPLLSDISPYVDSFAVLVQEAHGKSVSVFQNPAVRCNSTQPNVSGRGFLLLHLGVEASSPLDYGSELIDDGALISLSKIDTQKLRNSLKNRTNCYLYMGDRFSIAHFELRWAQDQRQSVHFTSPPAVTSSLPVRPSMTGPRPHSGVASTLNSALETVTPPSSPGLQSYPGYGVIRVHHTGLGSELDVAARAFGNVDRVLSDFEKRINDVCEEPLMKHANKMKPGETTTLQVRVVIEPGNKSWSVGPAYPPKALTRSLQIALSSVKTPVDVFEGKLELTFDVTLQKC